MKLIKKTKKLLGKNYSFKRFFSDREIFTLQSNPPQVFSDIVVASLALGYVKIDAVLFKHYDKLDLIYEIYVKDTPDSTEWIYYDSPDDTVKLKETEMFSVLDRIVSENNISYTACCFERLNGKMVIAPNKESKNKP